MTTPFEQSLRQAEATLSSADPKLGRVIARVGPCELTKASRFQPFHALMNSIAHQQLNGTAAATIMGRVRDRFADGGWPDPPVIVKAPLRSLKACGLSTAKALAFKDLAAKTLDGTVPTARALHRMKEDAIVARITEVKGIGPWTVEMMLMFRLGRLDVLPVDDFGVRKGFSMFLGRPELVHKRELAEYGERWRPYRSVASWYMWRVLDGR